VSWTSAEESSGSEDSSVCESFHVNDQATGTYDRDTTLPTPETTASAGNTLTDRGGRIWSSAVKWTDSNYTTHNCDSDPDTGEEVPCDYSAQDTTGTWTDGVGLEAPSGGNVMVEWPSLGAMIGAVGDPCGVLFSRSLSFEEKRTSVPLTTFQSPGEHSISFSGSRHFTQDDNGDPASIDYTWSFTLTFETLYAPG
jgi:hypothetical protein